MNRTGIDLGSYKKAKGRERKTLLFAHPVNDYVYHRPSKPQLRKNNNKKRTHREKSPNTPHFILHKLSYIMKDLIISYTVSCLGMSAF